METQRQIEQALGLKGSWNEQQLIFRVDPLVYGYMVPLQRLELRHERIYLYSSPLTNTEWWHQFMPVTSCPRYKGQQLEVADSFDSACRSAQCAEACGAEDQFVDLSAGRLPLEAESPYLSHAFPRLQAFLDYAQQIQTQFCQETQLQISLDYQRHLLGLQAHTPLTQLRDYAEGFQHLYQAITQIQGKVNTSYLPPAPDYSDVDITPENVMAEARYYGMVEAVRLEALDMLAFLVERKGGSQDQNEYFLPSNQLSYRLYPSRIEAYRSGLYMGREGFKKGVQELQQFFQTTLGGGRW